MSSTSTTMPSQLCTFRVSDAWCGVDVRAVQEVVLVRGITRVPLAPDAVRGLINLRGQIVTVIDLRRRLGFSHQQAAHHGVVICHDGHVVGLLVDEIGDVVDVGSNLLADPPATIGPLGRTLISCAYKLAPELVVSLSVEGLLAFEDSNRTMAHGGIA